MLTRPPTPRREARGPCIRQGCPPQTLALTMRSVAARCCSQRSVNEAELPPAAGHMSNATLPAKCLGAEPRSVSSTSAPWLRIPGGPREMTGFTLPGPRTGRNDRVWGPIVRRVESAPQPRPAKAALSAPPGPSRRDQAGRGSLRGETRSDLPRSEQPSADPAPRRLRNAIDAARAARFPPRPSRQAWDGRDEWRPASP